MTIPPLLRLQWVISWLLEVYSGSVGFSASKNTSENRRGDSFSDSLHISNPDRHFLLDFKEIHPTQIYKCLRLLQCVQSFLITEGKAFALHKDGTGEHCYDQFTMLAKFIKSVWSVIKPVDQADLFANTECALTPMNLFTVLHRDECIGKLQWRLKGRSSRLLTSCKVGLGKASFCFVLPASGFFSAIGTKNSTLSHFWSKMLSVGTWWTQEREEKRMI